MNRNLRLRQVGAPPIRPAIAPDAVNQKGVDTEARRLQYEDLAKMQKLQGRGPDTPFDLFDSQVTPFTIFSAVPVTVVSFTVAENYLLEIDAIGVEYNDPVLNAGRWLGWRITVNDARIPFFRQSGQDFTAGALGSVMAPMECSPFSVKNRQTVAVQVAALDAGVQNWLVVSARLRGRMYKLAGGHV